MTQCFCHDEQSNPSCGHTHFDTYVRVVSASSESKQDKLVGVSGQLVGFDENGNAIAQNCADEMTSLAVLAECGILTPVYQDGVFFTDDTGVIYVF